MSVFTPQSQQRAYQEALIVGSRLIYADSSIQVFSIENRWAAEFWFSETSWCVKERLWFEGYILNGPLILLRSLRRSRDYLLAPAVNEFRNIRNRRVSLRHFVSQHGDAAIPLRSLGVFWHSVETQGDWAEQICYAPPTSNPYYFSQLQPRKNRKCAK